MSDLTLCLDLGNTNLRLLAATQSGAAPVDPRGGHPRRACNQHGGHPRRACNIPDTIPTIMMLDERLHEVVAYGQPALDLLQQGVDNRRFVTELKPCLAQSGGEESSLGSPVLLSARLCPICKVARQPYSLFCSQCGSKLSDLPAPSARSFLRYSTDEAFIWAECLFTQVAQDLFRGNAPAPNRLVAGVPAHWNEAARTRYQNLLSGCFQGVPAQIVSEQEAVLRRQFAAGALDSVPPYKPVLIVDIGALTTDISLCTLQTSGDMLASARCYSEPLGGGDFDVALAVYLTGKLGISLDRGLTPFLILNGSRLKEQFSRAVSEGRNSCTLSITQPVEGNYVSAIPVSLDRADFESESLCGGLIRQFDLALDHAMQHFGVSSSEIGAVIVTGGGARWRYVQEVIRSQFPAASLIVGDAPERAVVEGLSLPSVVLISRPRPIGTQPLPQILKGVTPVTPQDRSPVAPQRGADIYVYLPVAPEEALHGAQLSTHIAGQEIVIEIPAGTRDGDQIHLPGRGEPGQDGGEPGSMTIELGIKPELEAEKDSSDPPTILPDEETPTVLPPVYSDSRATPDALAAPKETAGIPSAPPSDRGLVPADGESLQLERDSPPARSALNVPVIGCLATALLLVVVISGVVSMNLYSRLRDARYEAESAYRRIGEERAKRSVAEQALEKSEQERRRLSEELLLIKRRLSPFEVASYGADNEQPTLGSSRNLQELGSGLTQCFVYVVVKNNYFGVRDQNLDFAITVTWPNGQSATAKNRRRILSTEERHIYSGRFYMTRNSPLPDGEYRYQIRINDQSVGQGSFTIP